MEKSEEYKIVSNLTKGEFWTDAKKELEDKGFVEVEGQHFKSPYTGVVYRFVLKNDRNGLFVTSIDTLEDGCYSTVDFSVTDRANAIKANGNNDGYDDSAESKVKENLLYFLKSDARWFTDGLSHIDYSYAILDLKKYLGKKDNESFHSIEMFSLEFEGENVLCKLANRKPNSIHRAIKTPVGTLYGVPIKPTLEDCVESLLSFRKITKLIGFQGYLDIYKDQED